MNLNDVRPLQPLDYGNILIVGVKASNFDEEIRTHPRVIMWDSQNEHWTDKNLPQNVRAVFFTRFIGHAAFKNILQEARKKHISIFNPEGTGIIARQVKELLTVNKTEVTRKSDFMDKQIMEAVMNEPVKKQMNKLKPLIQHIDPNKSHRDNARQLLQVANAAGIQTTYASLCQFVGVEAKKRIKSFPTTDRPPSADSKLDVSVHILDGMIKELKDMREFLVATTKENQVLKAKLANFKKMLDI